MTAARIKRTRKLLRQSEAPRPTQKPLMREEVQRMIDERINDLWRRMIGEIIVKPRRGGCG